MVNKKDWGYHIGHCCKFHGCKYGEEDCPVVNGKVKQAYLCEDCFEDLEDEQWHKNKLQDIEEIKQLRQELNKGE